MLNSKLQEHLKSFPADFEILVDGHTDFAMQVSYFIKGETVSGRIILIADGKSDAGVCELQDSNNAFKEKNNIESVENKTCVLTGSKQNTSLTTEPDFAFLETATRNQKGNFYRQYADIMDADLKTLTKKSFMAKWRCESNTYYRCKERIGKFLLEKDKFDNSKSNQAGTTNNAVNVKQSQDKEQAKKTSGHNHYSEEEKISIVKEVLSIPNRAHKDVIRIAEKYGLHKRSLYGYMDKYAIKAGIPYIKNSYKHSNKYVNQGKKEILTGGDNKKNESKAGSENKKKLPSPATAVSDEDRLKIAADIRLGLFGRQILKKYHINIKAYSEIKKSVEAEKKKADISEDDPKDVKKRLKYGRSLDNDSSSLVPAVDNSGLDDKVVKTDIKTTSVSSFKAHRDYLKQNRENIIADVAAGMGVNECVKKWGISPASYWQYKRNDNRKKLGTDIKDSGRPMTEEERQAWLNEINNKEESARRQTGDFNLATAGNNKKDYPINKGAMTEEERDRFTRDLISRGF